MTSLINTCLRVIIYHKFGTSTLVYHNNFVTSFTLFFRKKKCTKLKGSVSVEVPRKVWDLGEKLILNSDVYKPEKVGVY